jgi:hypothetical protein
MQIAANGAVLAGIADEHSDRYSVGRKNRVSALLDRSTQLGPGHH